jgi:hypothetical protein
MKRVRFYKLDGLVAIFGFALLMQALFFGNDCHGEVLLASFDGNWIMKYSCESIDNVDQRKSCQNGQADVFMLYDMSTNGGIICGYHLATMGLHAKVDEGDLDGKGPSIFGKLEKYGAVVHFRSAVTGEVGDATLTLQDGQIHWEITKNSPSLNWFPIRAVLSRYSGPLRYQKISCLDKQ